MTTLAWSNFFVNQSLTEDDFITNLRARIDEDDEDLVSDIQLKAQMKQSLNKIAQLVNLIPNALTGVYTGEEAVDLPTGINKIGAVYMINGSSKELVPKSSLAGSGFGYIRRGNQIYLYGITVGSTLFINASKMPLVSADNGGYIDLPDDFMECLYTAFELFYWKRVRSSEEMNNSYRLYKEAIMEAQDNIANNYYESVSLYGKNT